MMITTTTINPALLRPSPNPLNPFTDRFQFPSPTPTKLFLFFNGGALSTRPSTLTLKCRSSSGQQREEGGSLKEVLSGMVDERVEQLLNKQENRAMLDGLEKATLRVETAKRELAELNTQEFRQEFEAKQAKEYIDQLESRASEIEECQKEILEARAMVEEAERALQIGGGKALTETEIEAMNKNEDRLESIKAGAIAAIVGTLAGLPISFTQVTTTSQLILPTAITFVSCALFGVTFRYAVRKDLDDFHLKTGTAAAFGVVKGFATLGGGPPLELEVESLLSHAFSGAIYVSQSLLVFLFAAVGLEYCMKLRILSTFPIERSGSSTTME